MSRQQPLGWGGGTGVSATRGTALAVGAVTSGRTKLPPKQIPYIHLHQHQAQERPHGTPQPGHGSVPQASSSVQRWHLSVPECSHARMGLEENVKTMLRVLLIASPGETSLPCKESAPPVIPASSQGNPFLRLSSLQSIPPSRMTASSSYN